MNYLCYSQVLTIIDVIKKDGTPRLNINTKHVEYCEVPEDCINAITDSEIAERLSSLLNREIPVTSNGIRISSNDILYVAQFVPSPLYTYDIEKGLVRYASLEIFKMTFS